MRRSGFRWKKWAASLAVAALTRCATVAPVAEVPANAAAFAQLPQEAVLYFAFRMVPEVREVGYGLAPQIDRVWERTRFAYGAVTASGTTAFGEGRYAAGILRCGLRLDRGWKAVSGSRYHWAQRMGDLEVAVPDRTTVVVGNTDIRPVLAALAAPQAREFPMPPDALRDMERSDAFAYLPEPVRALPAGLGETPLPLLRAWLTARGTGGSLAIGGSFVLSSDRGTRLFSLAVKALLTRLLRTAGIADLGSRLREVKVIDEGQTVRLEGLALTPAEVRAVIGSFEGR